MDCCTNAAVGAAAADVGHRRIDVGVRWLGLFLEERGGSHDLAGLAVAALRHVERQPRLLHGMVTVAREALDGDDLVARLHVLDQDVAGSLQFPVVVYGTGPALSGLNVSAPAVGFASAAWRTGRRR